MRTSTTALFAIIASGTLLHGCEKQECTKIGCTDSYTLFLEAPGTALTAGNYSISVTFDGTLVDDCTVLISDNATECGRDICILSNSCDLVDAVDNDLKQLQITSTQWEGDLPESVSLSLARDGVPLAERSFSPDYTEFFPNGEECDESGCMSSSETFVLPS